MISEIPPGIDKNNKREDNEQNSGKYNFNTLIINTYVIIFAQQYHYPEHKTWQDHRLSTNIFKWIIRFNRLDYSTWVTSKANNKLSA